MKFSKENKESKNIFTTLKVPKEEPLDIVNPPNISDLLVLNELHKKGKQTKFQLLRFGLKTEMIDGLVKLGFLTKELNPCTNIYQYKVDAEKFRNK